MTMPQMKRFGGRAALVLAMMAAACDTPAPTVVNVVGDAAAPDGDAPGADADAGGADADVAGPADADVASPADADGMDAADADVADAADADVADAADADATAASDADATAPDADAGAPIDAGPPRMTFTFVSAALSGGTAGGPQMRATITWHGALRGENDAGVRLEAFFR